MNSYLDWNIISDDFEKAKEQYDKGNRSWLLVHCQVVTQDGEIRTWSLHYDEYMYRKHFLSLSKEERKKFIEIQNWFSEIKNREYAEDMAGEDL